MRRLLIFFIFAVASLSAQSFNPSASNGSGCTANGFPTAGCTAGQPVLSTAIANTNAQTQVTAPFPANISLSDIHSYLYAGNTTRVLMHWQPWWGCSGHISIGMTESNSAQVAAQLTAMKSLGVDAVVVDYYGNSSSKSCNLTNTNVLDSVIAGDPTSYPKLMLGIDAGAFNNSGQCPKGSGITTAQMETCIEDQLDYAAVHYLYKSYYEVEGTKPIVSFFLDVTDWPSADFDTVWPHVHAHVAAGQSCGAGCTYTTQVLLLGRNSGDITQTGLDGSFAWSPTQHYVNSSPATQLDWNGTSGYLDNFYSIARANASKNVIGLIEVGFDDSNAGFGTGKIIARQCGNLPLFTAAKISSAGYSSSSQLKRVQIQTWNDYEEGTEVEPGIDPCVSISASVVGPNLAWTITKTDATYATLNTIDHLRLIAGNGTSFTIVTDNIAVASSGTVSLSRAPQGAKLYLQAVGKPMIMNVLSNQLVLPVIRPPNSLFARAR